MNVEGFFRDLMILGIIVGLVFAAGFTVYTYFSAQDMRFLYFGLLFVVAAVLGSLARYGWIVDYLKTLFDRWK